MKTFDDSKFTGFLEWQCEIYDYRIKSGAPGHTPTRDSGYGCRLMCSLSYISGSRLIALFDRFVIMTIIFKIHSDKAKAIGPMMFPWLLGANGEDEDAQDSTFRDGAVTTGCSTDGPESSNLATNGFTSVDYFGSNDLAREDQSIFINDKYHRNDVEKVYSYGSISASRRFLLITHNPEPVYDLRLQFVMVEFHDDDDDDDDDFAADDGYPPSSLNERYQTLI
ncbi:predicted protein [Histoplasma capsulatum G186AR]|uniref:Uncharacterized protein n=1 Tax=Ajellomyces capsulatus (strain G186AR / H82 / ATCC MYA-2454 / RMSCC 2432) TaxID=447093 RepID=C0NFY0_AJECG|nr:uncharacterized protein HCBG_01796 [Histoplasma capsulatum G186AR]EEH10151.1 predicted protein [Histoplasma capsulatum G186AR]